LELSGGRSKDTSTAVLVSQTTVVDAVGGLSGRKSRSLADSVLTITELTDNTALTTGGGQGEAALVASNQGGSRGTKGKAQCRVYGLHVLD